MCDVGGGPRIAVQKEPCEETIIPLLFSLFVTVNCIEKELMITMASVLCPRIIFRASRRAAGLIPSSQRFYSSKHPKGFVPPTQEDLTELRERVQEFTRKSISKKQFQKPQKLIHSPQVARFQRL
jgi:hypothetical protein